MQRDEVHPVDNCIEIQREGGGGNSFGFATRGGTSGRSDCHTFNSALMFFIKLFLNICICASNFVSSSNVRSKWRPAN